MAVYTTLNVQAPAIVGMSGICNVVDAVRAGSSGSAGQRISTGAQVGKRGNSVELYFQHRSGDLGHLSLVMHFG